MIEEKYVGNNGTSLAYEQVRIDCSSVVQPPSRVVPKQVRNRYKHAIEVLWADRTDGLTCVKGETLELNYCPRQNLHRLDEKYPCS